MFGRYGTSQCLQGKGNKEWGVYVWRRGEEGMRERDGRKWEEGKGERGRGEGREAENGRGGREKLRVGEGERNGEGGGGERGTCHCVPMSIMNELLSITKEKATLLMVQ